MKLHDLRPDKGAKKNRKRVGRGISAGQGKTAGRGTKGQGARSGGGKGAYFEGLANGLAAKRDRLSAGLSGLGFGVLDAKGSYFVTTDFRPLGFAGDDVAFCRWLTETAKVTAIPVSAFYADPATAPRHYARFAFCKHDATLDEALGRMRVAFAARAAATSPRALTA